MDRSARRGGSDRAAMDLVITSGDSPNLNRRHGLEIFFDTFSFRFLFRRQTALVHDGPPWQNRVKI